MNNKKLHAVHQFLLGEAPLRGYQFGDVPANRGTYWWRNDLIEAIAEAAPTAGDAGTIQRYGFTGARDRSFNADAEGNYVLYADHLQHVADAVQQAGWKAEMAAQDRITDLIASLHDAEAELAKLRAATFDVCQKLSRAETELVVLRAATAPVSAAPATGDASGARMRDVVVDLRDLASNRGYSHNDYADTMRNAANVIESLRAGLWNYAGIVAAPPSAGAPTLPDSWRKPALPAPTDHSPTGARLWNVTALCNYGTEVANAVLAGLVSSAGAPVSAAEQAQPQASLADRLVKHGLATRKPVAAPAAVQELPALLIKTRQQRQAEEWPHHPGKELAPWARLKLADAEIADLRAALAMHQPQGDAPALSTDEQARHAVHVCNALADTVGDDTQHPLYPMMDTLMNAISAWEDKQAGKAGE